MCHIARDQEAVTQHLAVIRWDELLDAGHLFHEGWQQVAFCALVGHRTNFFLYNEQQSACWTKAVVGDT